MAATACNQGIARQVRGQFFGAAYGPYSGTSSAMRHGKGFMQVQVADIGAYHSGISNPYLGIHIGPVYVNKPPF